LESGHISAESGHVLGIAKLGAMSFVLHHCSGDMYYYYLGHYKNNRLID